VLRPVGGKDAAAAVDRRSPQVYIISLFILFLQFFISSYVPKAKKN